MTDRTGPDRGQVEVPPAPVGQWLIAGTSVTDPYPCLCKGRCGDRCPCRGRTDAESADMPRSCCGFRVSTTPPARTTNCIDCGTPTPLSQWEIDSGSLLRRCPTCTQVVTDAQRAGRTVRS